MNTPAATRGFEDESTIESSNNNNGQGKRTPKLQRGWCPSRTWKEIFQDFFFRKKIPNSQNAFHPWCGNPGQARPLDPLRNPKIHHDYDFVDHLWKLLGRRSAVVFSVVFSICKFKKPSQKEISGFVSQFLAFVCSLCRWFSCGCTLEAILEPGLDWFCQCKCVSAMQKAGSLYDLFRQCCLIGFVFGVSNTMQSATSFYWWYAFLVLYAFPTEFDLRAFI